MSNAPPNNTSHANDNTNPGTDNGAQIQQKLLSYARDFALEKLNKTLDKRLAKRRQAIGDDDTYIDNDSNDDDGVASEMTHPSAHRQHRHQRRTTISNATSSTRRAPPPPPSVDVTTATMQHQRKNHTHHRRLHPADESSTVVDRLHHRQRRSHVVKPRHSSATVRNAEKGRPQRRHIDSAVDADDGRDCFGSIDYDTEKGARQATIGQVRKGSRHVSTYDNNRNQCATSPAASEFEDDYRRRSRRARSSCPDRHRFHQLVTQERKSAGSSRLRLHVMHTVGSHDLA